MAFEDYLKAQKMGQKAYKKSISNGQYPYLPVLDDILNLTDIEYEINLGIMQIPLDQVIGTCTTGRTNAFASNFMPLLDYDSEFGNKWSRLEDFQIEEGIHDEIKVYEYLHRYYVLEGNKRVSVLKFFESPSVTAEVIRKVPKKSNDPEILLYYEYMEFHQLTDINSVQFTKLGSYKTLLKATGKGDNSAWTDEERKTFSSFRAIFQKCYKEITKDKLENITSDDALLFYLSLYTYEEAIQQKAPVIKKELEKIWPEIQLLDKPEDPVKLVLDPKQETSGVKSVINKLKLPTQKKIAFVYDKKPEDSDWVYPHELGRLHVEEVLHDSIHTETFIVNDIENDAETVLENICKEGFIVIFTVSPQFIKACIKVATKFPNVKILNCSPKSTHNTVTSYYTRLYEAKFLTGLIAGSMCENDKIGYVADYPIYSMAANINAFALGAKMVNPRAKVYLSWSTVKQTNTEKLFWDEQINYISTQEMITPRNPEKHFGLYAIHDNVITNLASAVHDWGVFYERLINNILQGTIRIEPSVTDHLATNYWWGLSANVIDIIYSQKIPEDTVKLIHLLKDSIRSGRFHPFLGPIYDQNGQLRIEKNAVISPEDITTMDWLADNVVGTIPVLDELKDSAKPVVELRGLPQAKQEEKKGTTIL